MAKPLSHKRGLRVGFIVGLIIACSVLGTYLGGYWNRTSEGKSLAQMRQDQLRVEKLRADYQSLAGEYVFSWTLADVDKLVLGTELDQLVADHGKAESISVEDAALTLYYDRPLSEGKGSVVLSFREDQGSYRLTSKAFLNFPLPADLDYPSNPQGHRIDKDLVAKLEVWSANPPSGLLEDMLSTYRQPDDISYSRINEVSEIELLYHIKNSPDTLLVTFSSQGDGSYLLDHYHASF